MNCNRNCNRLCPNLIISTAVTLTTINGVDTLVIDIPAGTYRNGCKYCLVIAQTIPTTVTIGTQVAISIGGSIATVYPLVNRCCAPITVCAIRTRTRYPVCVATTATGGTFKVLNGLSCAPDNALTSLPVVAPAATPAMQSVQAVTTKTSKTVKEEN